MEPAQIIQSKHIVSDGSSGGVDNPALDTADETVIDNGQEIQMKEFETKKNEEGYENMNNNTSEQDHRKEVDDEKETPKVTTQTITVKVDAGIFVNSFFWGEFCVLSCFV